MRNLKRALSLGLTAAMISGLMVMGSSAASYADVADTDNVEAIEVLEAVGIMIGDENGNFNPDQNVTRNEMAVVMSNLMEYNVASYKDTSPFTDVPSWAEPYVAACYTNGITAGTSATTYGGSDTVTTAQAALMLMKALGYFQYASDFGGDWQLATVRQGNAIDLFVGVDSGVTQAMTRNDVAQLVLNTLESGTVKASTGGSITVGGVTINTDVKYDYVTSGETYAFAINNRNTNNDGDLVLGSIVELGEQLYMGDLRKDSGSDHFGRPSSIWEYKNDEIGTYPDDADYTYTDGISERDLYNRLGSNIMTGNNAYNWTVYYNGEPLDIDKPSRTVTSDYSETATGTLTEVFVDNVKETVTLTMVDTFLAEVVRVQEEDDGVTVYVNYLSDPTNNLSRETSVELDSTDLKVDDYVLVTTYENGNRYSIDSIDLAETVTGEVTAVRSRYENNGVEGRYAVMGNEQYDYVENTFAKDLAETNLDDPTINEENVLYLDKYGNMIAFAATNRTVDYIYVDDAIDSLGGISALATFADGRDETIYIDEIDGHKKPSTTNIGDGNPFVEQCVYAYEKQGDNYQLITLNEANSDTTSDIWTSRPNYDNTRNVGYYDDGTSGASNYAYDIKNGTNAIQATPQNAAGEDNGATLNVVSLTASTIFVDVEGNVVYTGYTNVPTMTDITFFAIYNRQLNADVVFITDGADNSTSDSFFFVTDDQPLTDIREGTTYYQYDVMMNNDPDATITFQGTNRDSSNRAIAEDTLYKIETITPDGFVKSASRVTGFGLGFDDNADYATYSDGYTLRLVRDIDTDIAGTGSNNLDNNTGEYIYTYDDETQFVYIQTKLSGGRVVSKDVNIGTSGMINVNNATDKLAGYNNVYVVAVDDKDARTPKATLIYIVEPVDGTFAEYAVTYPVAAEYPANITGVTVTSGLTSISDGQMLTNGTPLSISATAAPGYDAVIYVNGVKEGVGTASINVTGTTNITVAAQAKDMSVYEGTIDADVDFTSTSGLDKSTNAWALTGVSYTGDTVPTADQIVSAIIEEVQTTKGLSYVTTSGSGSDLIVEFKSTYTPYYVKFNPASVSFTVTLAEASAADLTAALTSSDKVIVEGNVALESDVTVPTSKTLEIRGDITAESAVTLDAATNSADIDFKGNVTIGENVTIKTDDFTADGTITVANGATFDDHSGAAFPAGTGSIVYVYGSKGQLNGTDYIGASGMVQLDANGVITISNKYLELTAGKATIDGLPAIQATDTVVVKSGATLAFASASDALTGSVGAALEIEAGATVDSTNFSGSVQNFYATNNSKIINVDDLDGKTYEWDAAADGSSAAGWLEQA